MASGSVSSSSWTQKQNKLFEKALAMFDKDTPERWQNIAKAVGGGKSVDEVQRHYQLLVEDLRHIESGRVPIPNYKSPGGTRSYNASAAANEESFGASFLQAFKES